MKGNCLCGEIEFEVNLVPGMVFNCHCSRCRVSHGADYATQAIADRSSLTFNKGQEYLSEYDSTGGIRAFCSKCGSRLMNYGKDGGDYLSVATSCLEESFGEKAVAHCFTGSKATWHEPTKSIVSHVALPPDL